MTTVSDLNIIEQIESENITEATPISGDNNYVVLEIELDNGMIFEGTVKWKHIKESDPLEIPENPSDYTPTDE
jgi:hypothetical protein